MDEPCSINSPDSEEGQAELRAQRRREQRPQIDQSIKVPSAWCGTTRRLASGELVWTCGACATPNACHAEKVCSRAGS